MNLAPLSVRGILGSKGRQSLEGRHGHRSKRSTRETLVILDLFQIINVLLNCEANHVSIASTERPVQKCMIDIDVGLQVGGLAEKRQLVHDRKEKRKDKEEEKKARGQIWE